MTFQKGNPGRPKGSRNKVSKRIAREVAAVAEVTPIEAMLRVLADYYHEYINTKRPADRADRDRAAEMVINAARIAAPYCHSRIAPCGEGEDDGKVTIEIVHSQRPSASTASVTMVSGGSSPDKLN